MWQRRRDRRITAHVREALLLPQSPDLPQGTGSGERSLSHVTRTPPLSTPNASEQKLPGTGKKPATMGGRVQPTRTRSGPTGVSQHTRTSAQSRGLSHMARSSLDSEDTEGPPPPLALRAAVCDVRSTPVGRSHCTRGWGTQETQQREPPRMKPMGGED